MTTKPEAVAAALKEAGVELLPMPIQHESRTIWAVLFPREASDSAQPGTVSDKQIVFLILSGDDADYFWMTAPALPPRSIESLSEDRLRKLIVAGSSVGLARVAYSKPDDEGSPGLFMATSECSTENYDAGKLRRRLEACATLAGRLSKILV